MKKVSISVSLLFMCMSVLFCVCLIAANLMGTKQIAIGSITVTGGLLVFPISYIINDCVSEVWGFRRARFLIWLGFAMNFFFVIIGALCDIIPPAPYWHNGEGFHAIFGLAPRIAVASFLAFLCGSFVNAYVMSRMKVKDQGHRFTIRAIWSSILGETVDSVVFFPLAFFGVIPLAELPSLVLWQVILKTAYEIVILPLTMKAVKVIKSVEGIDVYDENIDYNIFKIFNF